MNKHIDEGAASAGRDPSAVRRLLNISGRFARSGDSLLVGLPQKWAEELAAITLEYGVTGFILMADDAPSIELFASEVVPATRELLAAERATPDNSQRSRTYSASNWFLVRNTLK